MSMSMRNASDDLRISRSQETNGQAYLRRVPALAREFVYHNHCVSFVVYLPNKIHMSMYMYILNQRFAISSLSSMTQSQDSPS